MTIVNFYKKGHPVFRVKCTESKGALYNFAVDAQAGRASKRRPTVREAEDYMHAKGYSRDKRVAA